MATVAHRWGVAYESNEMRSHSAPPHPSHTNLNRPWSLFPSSPPLASPLLPVASSVSFRLGSNAAGTALKGRAQSTLHTERTYLDHRALTHHLRYLPTCLNPPAARYRPPPPPAATVVAVEEPLSLSPLAPTAISETSPSLISFTCPRPRPRPPRPHPRPRLRPHPSPPDSLPRRSVAVRYRADLPLRLAVSPAKNRVLGLRANHCITHPHAIHPPSPSSYHSSLTTTSLPPRRCPPPSTLPRSCRPARPARHG